MQLSFSLSILVRNSAPFCDYDLDYTKRDRLAVPYSRKLPCLFMSLLGVLSIDRLPYPTVIIVVLCRTTEARVESLGRLGHSMHNIGLVDRGSTTLPGGEGGGGGAPAKNGGTVSMNNLRFYNH